MREEKQTLRASEAIYILRLVNDKKQKTIMSSANDAAIIANLVNIFCKLMS
jgi:hypothetical protein